MSRKMKLVALGALLSMLAACGAAAESPYVPAIPSPFVTPSAVPTEPPSPQPSADKKDQYFRNCKEAREAGAAPLRRGVDDGYRLGLDRDKDGIACD